MRMRGTYAPVILVLFIFLSGCAIKHNYAWTEYPIASKRITQNSYVKGQKIKIIKGDADDAKRFLGNVGAHQYYGSEKSLTDGIADQLAKELKKKGIEIINDAEKSLEIKVDNYNFEQGMWKIAATINFSVAFGNEKTKSYTVRNSSPGTVDMTYNGAVALAVLEIMNDPEVLSYINK